ncbi:MAG: class I SAM-dependent methyltransferase [Phycisphaerales bacterium]
MNPVDSAPSEHSDATARDSNGAAHPHTPAELSAIAARFYTRGPLLLRLLNRYRPYICPFEALIERVPRGSTVLDVGCGGGLFLALLSATQRVRLGVGFDSSANAIATAQAIGLPECRFIRLDAAAPWPEEPALFDVVSIIDVMHHVPPAHQRSVIRTAAGRLSPGGLLIYKDMCRRPRWRAAANRLHDLVLAKQWINYAPVGEVENWAREAGLKLAHAANFTRLWYGHELRVFERSIGRDGA